MRIFCILLFALLIACKTQQEKYPGYTQVDPSIYKKLLSFTDTEKKPKKGDYLKAKIIFKTLSDSLFYDMQVQNITGFVFIPVNDSTSQKGLHQQLLEMNEGDSSEFIIPANVVFNDFFNAKIPAFLTNNQDIKMAVKLDRILTTDEYDLELQHYDELINLWEVEEQRRIQQYIKINNIDAIKDSNGIYAINIKDGVGAPVANDSGAVVAVNYTGYFMNGEAFDTSAQEKAFEFKIGEEYQVLWGLQLAIKSMKKGQKAKFIIPSYLAFGEKGSATGIVPPYTTVIYEVTLLTIESKIDKLTN